MYSRDAFVKEFEELLAKIPKDISFRQLQFDYRQVAFLMAQKLLERYPEILVGKEPSPDQPMAFLTGTGGQSTPVLPVQPVQAGGASGGPNIGPYPHELCHIVCTLINS
jgi:hypothetical protein